MTLLTGLAGACAGHGAPSSHAPAVDARPAAGGATQPDCAGSTLRAHRLAEAGKFWSATRALEACADRSEALPVLVRANLGLGKLDEASRLLADMPERDANLDSALRDAQLVQKRRKPAVDTALAAELDAIRDSLARGRCPEASERARQSFERWTPNPKALMLGAAAASCQGNASTANGYYARAAAELEASPSGLSWYQPKAVSASYFSSPNELVLRLGDADAILHVGSTPDEPATLTLEHEPATKPVWSDAQVEVLSEHGSLVGRAVGTHQASWKRALPDGLRDVVPAFSATELLLVHPDLEQFRSLWYRLESRTGKVVGKGTFPARYSDIMASTSSDWFAATAMTQEQQPHLMYLVFSSGRVKSLDLGTLYPCSPNAVLSPRELLIACPGELRALSVDTLQQRSLVRFPADFVAGGAVRGPGTTWAVPGRTGLALVELPPDGAKSSVTIPRELQDQEFSSVTWSPTGRSLVGAISRKEGLERVMLWDLQSSSVRQEFWHERGEPHPDAALSAAGDELVMGGCTELGRLHLDSARFETMRLSTPNCAGFTVAPTTGVLRISAYGDGHGVFWPKNGAPRPIPPIPHIEEVQAAGPWVAANTLSSGSLLLLRPDRTLPVQTSPRVLALSPDGSYAALREVIPGSQANILLFRLNEQDASGREVWRLDRSEFRYAAFTPDSYTLMLWSATATARLDLKTQQLVAIDARWPDRGARLFDESAGLLGGSAGLLAGRSLIRLDDWRPAETSLSLDLQFGKGLKPSQAFHLFGVSRGNRWIAGPIHGGAAIWRAVGGELVLQIQRSPAGGWFASAAAKADTQQSLVQPLGTERVPLWCRSGNELYEWRVCRDRFEEPSLVDKLLTGGSE